MHAPNSVPGGKKERLGIGRCLVALFGAGGGGGVVFEDDSQVYDLLCRKRHVQADLRFERGSQKLLDVLANLKAAVHIKVEAARELEVAFC